MVLYLEDAPVASVPDAESRESQSADLSTLSSASAVIGVPVAILVARQELDGMSADGRPDSLESLLTSALVIPHILSGDTTPSSSNALMPGLEDGSSDALVASMRHLPSLSAISRSFPNSILLHR